MVVSDLYAAGCPTGARLSQYPNWPAIEEAQARIEEALPFLPSIRNTSSSWGVRMILGDPTIGTTRSRGTTGASSTTAFANVLTIVGGIIRFSID
jgi:hypothetical protein